MLSTLLPMSAWLLFFVAGIVGSALVARALDRRAIGAVLLVAISMIIGLGAGMLGMGIAERIDWQTLDARQRAILERGRIVAAEQSDAYMRYSVEFPGGATGVVIRRPFIWFSNSSECGISSVVCALVAIPTALAVTHRRRKRRKLGHCLHCGYDLRGSPNHCPGCGCDAEE